MPQAPPGWEVAVPALGLWASRSSASVVLDPSLPTRPGSSRQTLSPARIHFLTDPVVSPRREGLRAVGHCPAWGHPAASALCKPAPLPALCSHSRGRTQHTAPSFTRLCKSLQENPGVLAFPQTCLKAASQHRLTVLTGVSARLWGLLGNPPLTPAKAETMSVFLTPGSVPDPYRFSECV